MTRWVRVAVAAIPLVAMVGCTSRFTQYAPTDGIKLTLKPNEFQTTSAGKGKDCVPIFLGFRLANPSFAKAEHQALTASGGQFLLNKRLYEGTENDWYLFHDRCTYVEGTGARF
jgi:hypothetical protein